MNVCFLFTGFVKPGGVERVVSVLINNLCLEKDLNIFCLCYTKSIDNNLYHINADIQCDYLYEAVPSMTNAILRKKAIKKVNQYIRNNKIDIIIGCGALYYPLSVICAKLTGIKSICWEHTNPKTNCDYRFQKQCRHIGLLLSNSNVVLSKKALDFYTKKRKINNYLIYNPVDPVIDQYIKEYNKYSDKIISVGRLVKVKNYEAVIDIAKSLIDMGWKGSWDIYGDGPEREHLECLIKEYGLEHVVNLMGNSNNIYNVYNNYSMLVLTSNYEGFPMVLIEGSAMGLPLVSFDIETGPNEIISNGKNGFLLNPGDLDGMVEKIFLLSNDLSLRKRMSTESISIASNFTIQQIVNKWRNLFDEICKG